MGPRAPQPPSGRPCAEGHLRALHRSRRLRARLDPADARSSRASSGLSPAIFTETTPGPGSRAAASPTRSSAASILTFLGIVVATPDRRAGRHLSRRIRQELQARRTSSASSTTSCSSAPSHPDRPVRLHADGAADGRLFGLGRRRRARHHRVPVIVRTTEDMLRLVPGIAARGGRRARRAACRR